MTTPELRRLVGCLGVALMLVAGCSPSKSSPESADPPGGGVSVDPSDDEVSVASDAIADLGGEPGAASGLGSGHLDHDHHVEDAHAGATVTPDAAASPGAGGPANGGGDEPVPATLPLPPAGVYTYATTGFHEEGNAVAPHRHEFPPSTTEDVGLNPGDGVTVMVINSEMHEGHHSKYTLEATQSEVHLVKIETNTGGLAGGGTAHPEPPPLVVRWPPVVGDEWAIEWEDAEVGVSAVGTGKILRREEVTTPAGTFDTAVLEVVQRARGTVEGEVTETVWIHVKTGMQVKKSLLQDLSGPFGASHVEYTSVLQAHPGA